jgi:site-specific recombinase XerD
MAQELDLRGLSLNTKKACLRAGLTKHVSLHSLRHAAATHLAEKGVRVHEIQKLLGHGSIETTMRYVHLAQDRVNQVRSPLDDLLLPAGSPVLARQSHP